MDGWMDGWMDALDDKVHKQRVHIPQHSYISHNHPYISSSEYCATYRVTATYIVPPILLLNYTYCYL